MKLSKTKIRAFILFMTGAILFLFFHFVGDSIFPPQTPEYVRLGYRAMPFVAIFIGVTFLVGEYSEKVVTGKNSGDETE